jgi:hypothetical protein
MGPDSPTIASYRLPEKAAGDFSSMTFSIRPPNDYMERGCMAMNFTLLCGTLLVAVSGQYCDEADLCESELKFRSRITPDRSSGNDGAGLRCLKKSSQGIAAGYAQRQASRLYTLCGSIIPIKKIGNHNW